MVWLESKSSGGRSRYNLASSRGSKLKLNEPTKQKFTLLPKRENCVLIGHMSKVKAKTYILNRAGRTMDECIVRLIGTFDGSQMYGCQTLGDSNGGV